MTARRICTVDGCTRPVKAHDRCDKHYIAARRRGDLPNIGRQHADRTVAELLARLAGRFTARQLQHWIHTGVISPAYRSTGSGDPHRLTPAEAAAVEDVVTMTEQLAAGNYYRDRVRYHQARAHYDTVAARS